MCAGVTFASGLASKAAAGPASALRACVRVRVPDPLEGGPWYGQGQQVHLPPFG